MERYIYINAVINCAGTKRGPRFGNTWKVHVFLLRKHNDDFVPSMSEQARLTRCGMGKKVDRINCDAIAGHQYS